MTENNIAADFEKSLEREAKSPAFKGTMRIFFLTLAIALLMQALSFVQMQVTNAGKILSDDFKILLTLDKPNAVLINEMGSALSSAEGITSLKFISAADAFEILKSAKPHVAEKFVFLNKNPMPEYFEIKLTPEALANVEGWLSANVSTPFPSAVVHYKAEQAKLIAYTAALGFFLNFLGVIVLVLAASFIFFVEAYGSKSACRRSGGIVISIFAFGISVLLIYVLTQPLVVLGGKYWVFTTPVRQVIIGLTSALLGFTFAKWKKF